MIQQFSLIRLVILSVVCLLSGCSAMVPMASIEQDAEAKAIKVAPSKSAIYVIRSDEYAGELHFVAIGKGERVALVAMTYAVFSVEPGTHTATLDSAVNREKLTVKTENGKAYFIEMSYAWAGGVGHVKVAPRLVNEFDGVNMLKKAKLVSSESD